MPSHHLSTGRRALPLRAWAGWEWQSGRQGKRSSPPRCSNPGSPDPPFIPPPRSQYGEDGERIMKAAARADQVPWQMGTGTAWHLGRAPQTRPASTFCCRYGARERDAVVKVPCTFAHHHPLSSSETASAAYICMGSHPYQPKLSKMKSDSSERPQRLVHT